MGGSLWHLVGHVDWRADVPTPLARVAGNYNRGRGGHVCGRVHDALPNSARYDRIHRVQRCTTMGDTDVTWVFTRLRACNLFGDLFQLFILVSAQRLPEFRQWCCSAS